jgi:hypothetical protein
MPNAGSTTLGPLVLEQGSLYKLALDDHPEGCFISDGIGTRFFKQQQQTQLPRLAD